MVNDKVSNCLLQLGTYVQERKVLVVGSRWTGFVASQLENILHQHKSAIVSTWPLTKLTSLTLGCDSGHR
jgi:hypothetical protein